jgi:hypothetical protein
VVDIRKRKLLQSVLSLFLLLGLKTSAPSAFPEKAPGQEQPERPKFYALRVVSQNDVLNAEDSLGAPDNRCAEILPDGQIVIFMENKLYPFPTYSAPGRGVRLADSGSIVGKTETDFVLEGWLPQEDTQGTQHDVWVPLGMSSTGFCIWLEGSEGVGMIRITNSGSKSLFVDAVIGYARETEEK